MNELQIIEHKGIRVVSTQQLADVYGTNTDTISKNFNRNRERYVEGKHYITLEGAEKSDFVNRRQLGGSLKKAKKLYLWTEKGAFLHAKSLNSDIAWEAYDRLIDTYYNVKQNQIDIQGLSPQLQLMNMIVSNMNRAEIEQKRQAEQIQKVEKTVETIKQIFTEPIVDWQTEINKRVREISLQSGIHFSKLYIQMYDELEATAHCNLNRLQQNKVKRMLNQGHTKTASMGASSKIGIIFEKPHLKAIFENIVKKYAMKYCS